MIDRRFTIGYLAPNVSDSIGLSRWHGVLDAAQEQDVNLICFSGSYWRDSGPQGQANVIYELIDPGQLDAIVLGNIVQEDKVNRDEFENFSKRRFRVPLVSMRKMLEGIPYVPLDDYQGVREAMAHLIEVHGLSRIAFLRGPKGHPYALARYQAYMDVLKEYGLPFRPELVSPPSGWNEASARVLLDERKLSPPADFEAVIAANDRKALNALRLFQARGMRVPGDVAVVGFNDDAEAKVSTPPLTSVAIPFYEQGRPLVKMLLALLEGKKAPEQVTLPTRLVVRQSCGCMAPAVAQAAAKPVEAGQEDLETALIRQREDILAEVAHEAGSLKDVPEQAAQLLDAFTSTFTANAKDGSTDVFLSTLDDILHQVASKDGDAAAWQGAISVLWRRLLPYLADGDVLARADGLWHQARVMIGETAERARMRQMLQANQWAEVLREVGATLITTFDMESLIDVLAEGLPRLNIPSAFLCLYENPHAPTEWSKLFLAYTEEGRIELQAGEIRFPSTQLIPERFWPTKRVTFVIEPLYFQERQIGFALFEVGPREGGVYDALRGSISSALQGAMLSLERQRTTAALEKAYVELERFNQQLEQMVEERTAELQRAYEQLEQLDRNKSDFIDIAAHELRTPLTVVRGYTEMLRINPTIVADASLNETLGGMLNGMKRLHQVVNSMLDVARIDSQALDLRLATVDITLLIRHIPDELRTALEERRLTMQLKNLEGMPTILADADLLHKVFYNLIVNAIKYTPDGGEITIAGRCISDEHLGECVEVTVSDTGVGIDPEYHKLIFEKFHQTGKVALHSSGKTKFKGGGPGLGLAIARGIVQAHNGRIWVESERHDEASCPGSCFHVLLPLPGPRHTAPQPVDGQR
ncbi:MAG: substrate-binding domain-containing protein [Thermoflexales bacterium]|nr:substrate-binding domain-containing protein [Thermoflexales bacterium]